jgi:hypothetical protein
MTDRLNLDTKGSTFPIGVFVVVMKGPIHEPTHEQIEKPGNPKKSGGPEAAADKIQWNRV